MHRDADGSRLVGNAAGDGLADPPGGVGRELVTATVLELVHGLHQADVTLLDQVQELQAAVGVLLGDRNDQAQVGFDHLLLGLAGLALALLDMANDAPELGDLEAGFGRQIEDVGADRIDLPGLVLDEVRPALLAELADPVEPGLVELCLLYTSDAADE